MNEQEHRAIISVCILAAFADGAQDDVERAQIQRIVNGFSEEQLDLSSAYQDVLEGKLSLTQVAAQLQAPSAKALAYEMAVCVCHADGNFSRTCGRRGNSAARLRTLTSRRLRLWLSSL